MQWQIHIPMHQIHYYLWTSSSTIAVFPFNYHKLNNTHMFTDYITCLISIRGNIIIICALKLELFIFQYYILWHYNLMKNRVCLFKLSFAVTFSCHQIHGIKNCVANRQKMYSNWNGKFYKHLPVPLFLRWWSITWRIKVVTRYKFGLQNPV